MDDRDPTASPFQSLPPVVVVLVVAIIALEIVFQAGASGLVGGAEAVGWRAGAANAFGFSDALFEWMRRNGTFPRDGLMRFVTYPFIHYEAMHAIFGAVLLLAMGKFVAERFSTPAVLIIFFGSGIAGALGYALTLDVNGVLIGAYPPVYGLIGAYTWILLSAFERAGENRLRAFQLIAFLVAIQLFFSLLAPGRPDWIADLYGFAAGFALSILLAPGGMARAISRLRQR